jgi:hypothetical protein
MGLSLGGVRETQRVLWGVAVSFYGVGDVVTTVAGFRVQSAAEAGPVALFALDSGGVAGFLVVKLLFIGACFGLWKVLNTPGRVAIPLALAVAGLLVTTWNVTVLVG